jgi:SAM-dependent methyltransferase
MPSPLDTFLKDFHARKPAVTSRALGALPMLFRGRPFPSSYHVLAAAIPPLGRPADVLDLACGDGFLLSLLASCGESVFRLHGLDQSAAELEAAAVRLGSTVGLHQGAAHQLPFESHSFDCVLCHMALMLMDDIESVLREIRRVLKPAGVLASIVGTVSRKTIALQAYGEAISRYPVRAEYSGIRFGDPRWREVDGIHDMLARDFRDVMIDDLTAVQWVKPDELWDWFLDMYDLALRTEAHQELIHQEFLSAVGSKCRPDGRLELATSLRYIEAKAE